MLAEALSNGSEWGSSVVCEVKPELLLIRTWIGNPYHLGTGHCT
jgi:hypothetical protein